MRTRATTRLSATPLLVGALALLALGGCSQKARDDTGQAADSIAADANTTMARAVNTVDAASDKALGNAERSMDNASATVDRTGDHAADAADGVGNTLDHAGDAVGNAAERASHATGRALKKAGATLDQ